ncbi:hypothetical protein Moror_9158, partial [Moniliophthora roreri MCA 2997]
MLITVLFKAMAKNLSTYSLLLVLTSPYPSSLLTGKTRRHALSFTITSNSSSPSSNDSRGGCQRSDFRDASKIYPKDFRNMK